MCVCVCVRVYYRFQTPYFFAALNPQPVEQLSFNVLVFLQSTQLQENLDHLKDEWAEFLKEQQRLKTQVDEEHDEAVRQLTTKYCEMEKDLIKSYPL